MTLIALIDTEGPDAETGVIDCMIGLPEAARAPAVADFQLRTSGTGMAEIVGLTAVAGRQRNTFRLTVRFAPDSGLLSVRYQPPAAQSAVVPRTLPPIEVSVVGTSTSSRLASDGDEWHLPSERRAQPPVPSTRQQPPAQVVPLARREPAANTTAADSPAPSVPRRPAAVPTNSGTVRRFADDAS